MSQHDFNIANQTFPSFRADLNDALQASATMSAGSSAPTTPYAYQLWFDTTTDTWKVRNSGNTAWISTITTDLATGNVGIETSSPSQKLTIGSSSIAAGTGLFQQIQTAGNNMYVGIGSNNSAYIQANGEFRIATGGYADRVTVNSSGNVGIGCSPVAKLHIRTQTNGNAAFQNSTSVTGGVKINAFNDAASASVPFEIDGSSLQFNIASSEKMRIDSSGNVGIGLSGAGTNRLSVLSNNPTNYTNAQLELTSNSGNVCQSFHASGSTAVLWKHPRGSQVLEARNNPDTGYININANAFAVQSDYRLKENVTYDWDATTRLKQLKPARFNFKPFAETGEEHHSDTVDGFLAHEVSHDSDGNPLVPEAVTGTKDAMRDEEYEITPAVLDEDGNEITPAVMGTRSVPDYQGIDQSKLTPLLTKALIEAVEKIEQLEARITALEAN